MEGLFLELSYDPNAKHRGFFGGSSKGEGDEKLIDYLEGYMKEFKKEDIYEVVMKKGEITIPKGEPTTQPTKVYDKVYGRWTSYMNFGE